jgi:hypothetical protein
MNLAVNTVIDKRDSFAPINCLLTGEALGESPFLEVQKFMVNRIMKALRSDLKFINPDHIDFLSHCSTQMTAEDKKKNYKRLSRYFTTEFLNNPNIDFGFKKAKGYIHANSLLGLVSTALAIRNIKRDQSLVMTSNITRNVLDNNFDLDIPIIPSGFMNTYNFVLHLTDGGVLGRKLVSVWPEEVPPFELMQDNFILNFNDTFSSFILNVFYRNKISIEDSSSDSLRIRSKDEGDLATYSEMTFRDLDYLIDVMEEGLLEVEKNDLDDLVCNLRGMYILKLLAVGLHTHKDIATPEVLKFLVDHSDLRKYPENVSPINKEVTTEEVVVNESESNSFRVVRMPQGSVHLIGHKIPENYDPDKKTTVPPSMRHYWVVNKQTGEKEKVLRPCREHKRPSQYRKKIYAQHE